MRTAEPRDERADFDAIHMKLTPAEREYWDGATLDEKKRIVDLVHIDQYGLEYAIQAAKRAAGEPPASQDMDI